MRQDFLESREINTFFSFLSQELCREKVENAPCKNDGDCFCSRSVHPYTCHETLGVCTKKGRFQKTFDVLPPILSVCSIERYFDRELWGTKALEISQPSDTLCRNAAPRRADYGIPFPSMTARSSSNCVSVEPSASAWDNAHEKKSVCSPGEDYKKNCAEMPIRKKIKEKEEG